MVHNYSLYADESGYPHVLVQSICMIGGKTSVCNNLQQEFQNLLETSACEEIKFSKIKAGSPILEAAESMLDILIPLFQKKELFVFNLVDPYATQHSLEDLYKRLFAVVGKQTRDGDRMLFFPDENHFSHLFSSRLLEAGVHPEMAILPQQSHKQPLIQACDLIAGMCRDAYLHRGEYLVYFSYPPESFKKGTFDKTRLAKAELLGYFLKQCDSVGIPISYQQGYLDVTTSSMSLACLL